MPPEPSQPEAKRNINIPIAIIVAGLLVAGALYLANRTPSPTPANNNTATQKAAIRPVSASDHILGNPNADIVIVEYSDLECPFCKTFHATMHAIMDEYGKDGTVAWVFRNAPIPQLHPKAPREHEAAECVAELAGNDVYWQYIDKIYAITPSNNGLDLAQLSTVAASFGINSAQFQSCLDSGKHQVAIQADFDEGLAAATALLGPNSFGTPFSVALVGDQTIPIEGSQPLSAMRNAIQSIIAAQASTQK